MSFHDVTNCYYLDVNNTCSKIQDEIVQYERKQEKNEA